MRVRLYYEGAFDPEKDKRIHTVAGRHSEYSGYGFGERDHGWVVADQIEAHAMAVKLRAAFPTDRIEVQPESVHD